MPDTLKDFLVGIGFKVDKASQVAADAAIDKTEAKATKATASGSAKRKKIEKQDAAERKRRFDEETKREQERQSKSLKSLETFASRATKLFAAGAIIRGIEKIGSAVDAAASKFERLNYVSRMSGSTAGGASAFGYAAGQLGGSAGEAQAQLTAFGQKLKTYQGYEARLKSLGIKTREANGAFRETADIATDLGDKLRDISKDGKNGYGRSLATGQLFGFDGMQAQAMMRPEFRKYQDQQKGDAAKIGANQNAAAESGAAFEQSLRRLDEVLEQIGTKVNGVLFVKLKPLLDQLAAWFLANGDKIADIVGQIADGLIKLARAIADDLASADWKTILDKVKSFSEGLGWLLGKLSGNTGLVAMIIALSTAMRGLALLAVPPWLLAMLGVSMYAGAKSADAVIDYKKEAAGMPAFEAQVELQKHGLLPRSSARKAFDYLKGKAGLGDGSASGNDAIWSRSRKGRAAREAGGPGYGGTDAPLGAPGEHRPQYQLADADLSDKVVNTIAGEANNNQESTDAVVNNMLNRVGTTTYGPSRNLQDVAGAPGQYAGYRRASAKQAEFIRTRIKAIASGAIPDNTHGSNEYRASWYDGPWARNHPEAAVVGGNRYAYNPKGGKGPFAPYDKPHKLAPMLREKPLGDARPMVPSYVPGQPMGLKSGGYLGEGLDASGKPVMLAPQHTSYRGDTNVNHTQTFQYRRR